MLERTLIPKLATSLVDERNTQVDASNQKRSLLDDHPFYKRRMLARFPPLKYFFLSGCPLPKEFLHGEVDRETL